MPFEEESPIALGVKRVYTGRFFCYTRVNLTYKLSLLAME